jgi:hypothetical protein
LYIVQITTKDGDFGEPLYFKSADKVGPFLRDFPDHMNAKTRFGFPLKKAEEGKTAAADATIKQIGELVKGKKLVDLRKPLEGMFPKKSIDFAFEGGAHYTIKHKGKTILIVNEKYADNPDLVVDGIAIGYDS